MRIWVLLAPHIERALEGYVNFRLASKPPKKWLRMRTEKEGEKGVYDDSQRSHLVLLFLWL